MGFSMHIVENNKGVKRMRIDGKRASEYSQDDILLMLFKGESLSGSLLTDAQKVELAQVYSIRM